MKKFLSFLILCVTAFAIVAQADTNFNAVDLTVGNAAAGVNWSVPYMVNDIEIKEMSAANTTGTNWTQLTFWDSCAGQTENWSNLYTIQAGSSWHRDQFTSHCDSIGIRGQSAGEVVQIQYVSQDPNL